MVEKKKFTRLNVLEVKLRSEINFFLEEREKWRNFQCKLFGIMKKIMARLGVFSPINGRRASELIFNVKMFGNFFEIPQSSVFSNFWSGPLI